VLGTAEVTDAGVPEVGAGDSDAGSGPGVVVVDVAGTSSTTIVTVGAAVVVVSAGGGSSSAYATVPPVARRVTARIAVRCRGLNCPPLVMIWI
jgi:hypothetical protein